MGIANEMFTSSSSSSDDDDNDNDDNNNVDDNDEYNDNDDDDDDDDDNGDDYHLVQVPLAVPIIVLAACVYLLLAPIIQDPGGSGSFTLLILVLGLFVYVPFVHMNLKTPGMGMCNRRVP